MKTFIKEDVFSGELELYEVLNSIAQKYNSQFSTLVIPHALKIDKMQRTLTLPLYEGELFDDKWDIPNGGAPLKLDLSKEMPLVLKDLQRIDTDEIVSSKQLAGIYRLVFDHEEAKDYYIKLAHRFGDLGALSSNAIPKIKEILIYRQQSKMVINNGDFYQRNLIRRTDGKMVLIDWETYNPHAPFYIVDHPENVAALPLVSMWGNLEWQEAYIQELEELFSFTKESFNKGIVIKALEMAKIFDADRFNKKGRKQLILDQMKFIENVLA